MKQKNVEAPGVKRVKLRLNAPTTKLTCRGRCKSSMSGEIVVRPSQVQRLIS